MKGFIEKLITRIMLESASCKVYKLINPNKEDIAEFNAYKKCIEIINQLAEEYKPKTNADRIRNMSDEELAEITLDYDDEYGRYWCSDGTIFGDYEYKEALKHEIDWLQSEVEGVTENE